MFTQFFVVGTAYVEDGDEEPSKGRVLLISLTDDADGAKTLTVVAEKVVKGSVYQAKPLDVRSQLPALSFQLGAQSSDLEVLSSASDIHPALVISAAGSPVVAWWNSRGEAGVNNVVVQCSHMHVQSHACAVT